MALPSNEFFPGTEGQAPYKSYANPFYGIAMKYMPWRSIDDQLWWANHFLLRFGFYRSALSRIANYFITSLKIECDDSEAKEQYEEILNDLRWKQKLAEAGLNLLAYGNIYLSANQGFDRFVKCPTCHKITSLNKIDNYQSKDGDISLKCISNNCKCNGKHEIIDRPSKDASKINTIIWNPREIKCFYEETSDKYEYFWDIPNSYKNKIQKDGDKFYSKNTAKVIFDAIKQNKLLAFNENNFIHLRYPTPAGIKTDGRGIPPCIYLFDDFFMLKVLQRYNEAICMEDIVPFRVISLTDQPNAQANPILATGAPGWRTAVENMVDKHRRDPGSYHVFPFPLHFQHLGGDAKELTPHDFMQQAIANILNALQFPQELYTMTLQVQAVGPALRLFENSWSLLIDVYNQLLNHLGEVIGKIKGLPKAKITLLPTTLSDDIEKKSVLGQLVAANSISRSTMLDTYGISYEDQIRKKLEEDRIVKEIQEEEGIKEQLRRDAQAGIGSDQNQSQTSTPQDVLAQAQEIAQQLFPLDGAQRREQLQKIKAQDATLWSAVKGALQEMNSGARSAGVEQAKAEAGGQ